MKGLDDERGQSRLTWAKVERANFIATHTALLISSHAG